MDRQEGKQADRQTDRQISINISDSTFLRITIELKWPFIIYLEFIYYFEIIKKSINFLIGRHYDTQNNDTQNNDHQNNDTQNNKYSE
jgi:hypothetical protein